MHGSARADEYNFSASFIRPSLNATFPACRRSLLASWELLVGVGAVDIDCRSTKEQLHKL